MISTEASSNVVGHLMGVARFERFFRLAAGLDVDKQGLKRYGDFTNRKINDMMLRAQASAKANGRFIIEPFDLPITKGLQEGIHAFRNIEEEIELQPILDHLTARPPLDVPYSDETEIRLPEIAGGLSVALAHTFKILDSKLKNPHGDHWERCFAFSIYSCSSPNRIIRPESAMIRDVMVWLDGGVGDEIRLTAVEDLAGDLRVRR
ncbi:hypothetical protein M2175_003822 [Bradyrhizobium elkanii]|uniref:DUF1931 family protein n=1 Tax=Bradyrhizobium TaxID=374 RepID=UPI00216AB23E|nr:MULTISPECIES: DUF1931 family protein [Bradyrhizobium]MCS3928791.1 hypothetical protein [Bradyrhizobium elkanii]MCS3969345.1 hypothetical protein [Bradyrhizobium japonicum]